MFIDISFHGVVRVEITDPRMLKLMKEIGMHHACDMIFTVSRQNPNLYATREELIAALESKGFANDSEFQKYGDEHGC